MKNKSVHWREERSLLPFFLSMLTAFITDGVLELDRSENVVAVVLRPFCGGGAGAAGVGLTAAAADDADFVGISLMSLASIPISCICFARFSAWLMNCIGADNASTRSSSTINRIRKCQINAYRRP